MHKVINGRENNFDLIRLFAALQVVIFHSIKHYDIQFNQRWIIAIIDLMKLFPGVPIFFTISGFLVYQSFERNAQTPSRYFKNRFLRLYPGLWMMVLVMAVVILIEAYIAGNAISMKSFLIWLFCELSFFQFYTPDSLRFWGVGAPNGSLWTIVTEIQFYIIVPLLFNIARISRKLIPVIFIGFVFVHLSINQENQSNNSNLYKLISISIANYLYYFLIGTIFYLYRSELIKLWTGKWLGWLIVYIGFNYLLGKYVLEPEFRTFGNIIAHILLSFSVLSFVFSRKHLSELLLKGNDISYGIYIYHMIVVNIFVQRGLLHRVDIFFLTLLLVIITAFMSWRFIEKPALKLKSIASPFLLKFGRNK